MQSQKRQNDLCSFLRQTIRYQRNQIYALTSNAEEAEVEWFYEDLQDLLELTPKKGVLSSPTQHLEFLGSCTVEAWLGEF